MDDLTPQNISLGLKKEGDLIGFSKKFDNAPYMDEWADQGLYADGVQSFDVAFQQATDKVLSSGGRIKFNLTNFDYKKAMGAKGKGLYDEGVGYTDWEFNQILSNDKLLKSTDFYDKGELIPTEKVLQMISN